jgi:predicted ATP-dependent serine protease
MTNTGIKESALKYAAYGLAVFPLKPKSKQPATSNGFKDATTDTEQITAWWDKNPNYNIGIATGSVSGGLMVIDLDRDEDKGKDGYGVLREWETKHGELPETATVITGRGGYHLYFTSLNKFKSKVGLYDGVDIRGEGGYVVAPPSIHENGHQYEWEYPPDEYSIKSVTSIVKEFLKGEQQEKPSKPEVSETIPEGQRVSTLIRLIGSLKSRGVGADAIRAAVAAENTDKCIPPLTDTELEKEVFPALERNWKAERDYTKEPTAKVFNAPHLKLRKASEVIAKEPEWLIPGYIPRYGITTIAADGGVGKTSTTCSLIASITTGKQSFLTGGIIPFESKPEKVLVLSAEDSWEYVLKNRLAANGADFDMIDFLAPEDEGFELLNFNSELLQRFIEESKPSVVVFDPLQAFIPENLRMGERNSMRKCLSPLMGYGKRYGITSIIIAHSNKQGGVWGRKRIADSADIWDASRSVLMMGLTENEEIRYISHEKSNYGRLGDTVLFSLNDQCVPIFKGFTKKKDREFVQAEARQKNIAPAMEEAKEFILETLKEHRQMEVSELDELAAVNSISKNALKEAKADLRKNLETRTWSIGYGKDKKFFIALTAPEKINQ